MRKLTFALFFFLTAQSCLAQSIYSSRPDDPQAIYLAAPTSGADQSAALQDAIDRAQQMLHHGLVFVPEGRYSIEHTVHVWAGIRLIGYGAHRPVFVLPPHTSEFSSGPSHYMLWYTDERTPAGQPIADASEFTFYSALNNIDFEMGEGNSSAVAIRFNVAQHSFVTHSNISVGSGKAGLEAIGNQASDIHVTGGDYGIITGKTSPAWQFLLLDSSFDGQRKAAISTHEAGFTMVRDTISNTPVAIEIPDGQVEQLYVRDLQLNNISQLALKTGDAMNLRDEITLKNIACSHVAAFTDALRLRSPFYVEEQFTLGLEIGADGREQGIQMHHREQKTSSAPPPVKSDIPPLPATQEWVNVHKVGVAGDGGTDDTAALQKAINDHRVLYFPSGWYRLTNSLKLRPDSVLIGFSPFTTQFILVDGEAAFQGAGPAVPLLIAPAKGKTIVTGFGIATGNLNPRACGIEWVAGANSLLDDTEFIRGHDQRIEAIAPKLPTAPQGIQMQLDAQYPSLWVHNGGGGIFRDLWSHAGTAKAGVLVENTDTPGVVYQLSNEHHMQREVRFDHVSNWTIYDQQTEEEKPEGSDAVALEVVDSRDLTFVNTYMYRVSRNIMPKITAATTSNSNNISFENVKVFSQTRLSFDNSLLDEKSGVRVRAHHFVHLLVTNRMKQGDPLPKPMVFTSDLHQVATGFSNASGFTADPNGAIYFTDAAMHSVYKCSGSGAKLLVRTEQMPQIVAYTGPDTLLAVNWERTVSLIKGTSVQPLTASSDLKPGTTLLLPVGMHNEEIQLEWLLSGVGYNYRIGSNTATRSDLLPEPRTFFYVPDTKLALETGPTFRSYAAWAWRPLPESSQLIPFPVGSEHYVVSEDDEKTYRAKLVSDNKLDAKLAIERGGSSVVTDSSGNVYIAGAEVFVYDRAGKQIGVLEIPERPGALAFGGQDRRTLFIGARSSVYAIETKAPGE